MSDDRFGYGQYCPVAHVAEILDGRWSLLILRDLLTGSRRFNDLARGEPGLSRSLLAKRLRQFERAGIVAHVGDEYVLTPAGEDLRPSIFSLGEWGARWTFGEPDPRELDAELLVWWMHTRLDTTLLPAGRSVLHVRFSDDPKRFWLVIAEGRASICLADPGFGVDVTIATDLASLYEVWLGRLALADAIRRGAVQFDGPRALVRRMPQVLKLSPVAGIVAASSR